MLELLKREQNMCEGAQRCMNGILFAQHEALGVGGLVLGPGAAVL